MLLINIDELDRKLWSPESLKKGGPNLRLSGLAEPWRDILRSNRSNLRNLMIGTFIYGLVFLATFVILTIMTVMAVMNEDYKLLWLLIIDAFLLLMVFQYFRDAYKLVFYIYFSKRNIHEALSEEMKNEQSRTS